MRLLPELTPETTPFWTGGAEGRLMIVHCDACDRPIHPPQPICAHCLSRAVSPRTAAGTGEVLSVTVNHQAWFPGLDVPYALAIVALDGEPGVRLTAQVRGVEPDRVTIGMRVRVAFDAVEDVWIPCFEPDPPM